MNRLSINALTPLWLLISVLNGSCVRTEETPVAGGSDQLEAFWAEKGPAHSLVLPYPGEKDWRYLIDDTWRYVAPENAGRLYDAAYFNGQWFVLHGKTENSEKLTISEINWLSATRDGLNWETLTLTTEPYESYTRLASNGHSLLLAGTRHIAELADDGIRIVEELDQQTAPPAMIPHPKGYVLARKDDIIWLGLDRSIQQTYQEELAQFRGGTFAANRFIATGPFSTVVSSDGQTWTQLSKDPCSGCGLVGIVYGNGVYLAADPETLYTSTDGENWQQHIWERAIPDETLAPNEQDEDKIARIDFTAGHFILHTWEGNTSLSKDGVIWTAQLKIPFGQIGPAACNQRCLVAGGRLLLPPIVLSEATPPANADTSSPYYCQYNESLPERCFDCGGATVETCREGVICRQFCENDSDCPVIDSGNPSIKCISTQVGGECMLFCNQGESCPAGMTCSGGTCFYIFDDPRCRI